MNLEKRIQAFAQLGNEIEILPARTREGLVDRVSQENPWFTSANVDLALKGIRHMLRGEALTKWTLPYHLDPVQPKAVGVAMAGNIPMVGFHDLLSVLMSGHHLVAKLSSQDTVLMQHLIYLLCDLEPDFGGMITQKERFNDVDAVIATGSNNTARYFEYYFRKVPHILRKNRSSCAIIQGEETPEQLIRLGSDVFSYFGLGCRNISKLYVPAGYDFSPQLLAWEAFHDTIHHHKYANNYDYQKSIMLINRVPFLDNGSVLLNENKNFVSPISVVYFEYYKSPDELNSLLALHQEKLQTVVSVNGWYEGSKAFGQAQFPEVWEYADQVDTLKFLEKV